MNSRLDRRLTVAVAVLLIGILLLAPRMSPAGVWDVNGSNPITIINHSPTIDYRPIENMFGSTSYDPIYGTANYSIFSDGSGNAGYVDYVEWRTNSPIDLPGFTLNANKDGDSTNRMFTWFALYYSEDSGATWIKFYEKNVADDYSGGWLYLNVPSSNFLIPVQGKQYFRAEFCRGGGDPNVDGPRVGELDGWPLFNYIEVRSENHQEYGWRLNTSLILSNADSPTITYSVDGGSSNPLSRVAIPYYQSVYMYDASVTYQLGGSPPDYIGSTFTWTVDDTNDLTATGTVSSGIRQIPLSTNLTISGDSAHPTVSWHNPDPNLDQYVVRIIVGDLDQGWVWQTALPYSSYGANPVYTISDFTFDPGIDYWIRIEAREWLSFPFAEGSDIPTPTENLQLLNRSTVVRPYTFLDEMVVDLGSLGVYHYDGTSLKRINTGNPNGLAKYDDKLVANFLGDGLYEYDGTKWRRLSSDGGQEMMCGTNNALYVDFGASVGLYKYDGAWKRINKNSPQDMRCVGADVYVDFGAGIGLYKYDGIWNLLTKSDPEDVCVVGSTLYVDLGDGVGLYKYDGGTWKRINKMSPEVMSAVGSDLYADFGVGVGLYKYNGTWTRVSKSDPEELLSVGTALYVDFGALGLYKYEGGVMSRIHKSDVEGMWSYANKLVANFPSVGMYEYNGSAWKKINSNTAEDTVAVNLY